ncbi:MAG TPA: class I SAM-dependent methyltransferase, partial [bacterium]|nr:class I SAM-dependent methyltransferase [bacterium]
PPTSFQAESFDLVLGLSIFTHLNEQDQFAWLSELRRLSCKGALILVSVHGEPAICRLGEPSALWTYRASSGFLDLGANHDLKGILPESSYRSIYHSPTYIRDNWSRYFTVLRVIPGYFWGYQDLVVLRND